MMVRHKYIRRKYWRIARLIVAVPVLLLLVRLAWGFEANRRLANTQRSLGERGLRVHVTQFHHSPMPEADNATIPLLRGVRGMKLTTAERNAILADDPIARLPMRSLGPADTRLVATARTANTPLLQAIDKAGQCKSAAWKVEGGTPMATLAATMPELRTATNLLLALALMAQDEGNDVAALAHIRRLLIVARVLAHHPELTLNLQAWRGAIVAAQMLERLQNTLVLTPETTPLLKNLAALMLDDAPFRAGLLTALEYEAANCPLMADKYFPDFSAWWIRPLMTRSVERSMTQTIALRDTVEHSNYVAVQQMLERLMPQGNLNAMTISFAENLAPSRQMIEVPYRAMTDRHAVALLAGLQIYAHEHAGSYPKTTAELVPAILPVVPTDFFSAENKPLRFHAESTLMVWSVGRNGADDDGSSDQAGSPFGPFRWRGMDAVYGSGGPVRVR